MNPLKIFKEALLLERMTFKQYVDKIDKSKLIEPDGLYYLLKYGDPTAGSNTVGKYADWIRNLYIKTYARAQETGNYDIVRKMIDQDTERLKEVLTHYMGVRKQLPPQKQSIFHYNSLEELEQDIKKLKTKEGDLEEKRKKKSVATQGEGWRVLLNYPDFLVMEITTYEAWCYWSVRDWEENPVILDNELPHWCTTAAKEHFLRYTRDETIPKVMIFSKESPEGKHYDLSFNFVDYYENGNGFWEFDGTAASDPEVLFNYFIKPAYSKKELDDISHEAIVSYNVELTISIPAYNILDEKFFEMQLREFLESQAAMFDLSHIEYTYSGDFSIDIFPVNDNVKTKLEGNLYHFLNNPVHDIDVEAIIEIPLKYPDDLSKSAEYYLKQFKLKFMNELKLNSNEPESLLAPQYINEILKEIEYKVETVEADEKYDYFETDSTYESCLTYGNIWTRIFFTKYKPSNTASITLDWRSDRVPTYLQGRLSYIDECIIPIEQNEEKSDTITERLKILKNALPNKGLNKIKKNLLLERATFEDFLDTQAKDLINYITQRISYLTDETQAKNKVLEYLKSDPTSTGNTVGKYASWILKIIKDDLGDKALKIESSDLHNTLKHFNSVLQLIPPEKRNINQYISLEDLKATAFNYKGKKTIKKIERKLAKSGEGWKEIANDDEWRVIEVTSYKAWKYWGSRSWSETPIIINNKMPHWCTLVNLNYWHQYTAEGTVPKIMFLSKQHPAGKHQDLSFNFATGFVDFDDAPYKSGAGELYNKYIEPTYDHEKLKNWHAEAETYYHYSLEPEEEDPEVIAQTIIIHPDIFLKEIKIRDPFEEGEYITTKIYDVERIAKDIKDMFKQSDELKTALSYASEDGENFSPRYEEDDVKTLKIDRYTFKEDKNYNLFSTTRQKFYLVDEKNKKLIQTYDVALPVIEKLVKPSDEDESERLKRTETFLHYDDTFSEALCDLIGITNYSTREIAITYDDFGIDIDTYIKLRNLTNDYVHSYLNPSFSKENGYYERWDEEDNHFGGYYDIDYTYDYNY